jgi:DNA-binding YbaB/EbfC family protein
MFKGLANLGSMMKQAAEMQGKMEEMQENLKKLRVSGTAGGGMVSVEVNGQFQAVACKIDPGLFQDGDQEMVEDLMVSAMNQAIEKAKLLAAEEMNRITGGLNLPGMQEMLSKFGLGG